MSTPAPTSKRATTPTGNSPEDWEIFDILCKDFIIDTTTGTPGSTDTVNHSVDLVTTLRSEIAALSYKRDRLCSELTDVRSTLCAKEAECENLRAQTARQTALVSSLQNRLQASENREHGVQARCDSTIQTIQREKRCVDERNKELMGTLKKVEMDLANEESQKECVKKDFHEFLRKMSITLGMDVCETGHLSPECVLSKTGETVTELHRLRTKISSTCDTLTSCENELLNLKSISNSEKQRLCSQIEAGNTHAHELEARCRNFERDLQIARDRLTESEINSEKLKEELRGFESRCHRLQSNLDRLQTDRIGFLKSMASIIDVPEPCETLLKDRMREMNCENKTLQTQLNSLKDKLCLEEARFKESQETIKCRLREEECHRSGAEEKLEKAVAEIHDLQHDHITLGEYLVRLARALSWSECTSPPAPGNDTVILAETLLERAERLLSHHENHCVSDKNCCEHLSHSHHTHRHHHPAIVKVKPRPCHDLKDSSTVYNLQRRVRVLREQIQRRDLHLELMKRKIALLEDGQRGKCVLQGERDEAVCKSKKATKQIDKLMVNLSETKHQLGEMKAQLAEAAEYKIVALERARRIDELSSQICSLETDKNRLNNQLLAMKDRAKSAVENSHDRRCRDESLINSLRTDVSRMQNKLTETQQRLSNLQNFRTSVARTLHLRDLPETDLLQRLHTLCSAHQEFTMLSKRYEAASPIGDHSCPRFEDPVPPSTQCRPVSSSSPRHHHRSLSLHHSRHLRPTHNIADHKVKHCTVSKHSAHNSYDDLLSVSGNERGDCDDIFSFRKKY